MTVEFRAGPRVRETVRRRTTCVVVLLAALVWGVPHMAAAEAPPAGASNPDRWPMAFTRAVHRARLQTLGATITRAPDHRLQQAPNDCAIAVVNELQRTAGRPLPNRDWLAQSLALGPLGVALDSLAPAFRRLGWSAHTTRGDAALLSHPLYPPAVALMRPGHFVLLTARTADGVEYFDPLVGLVQQPLPSFEAQWTGKGVQLSAWDN